MAVDLFNDFIRLNSILENSCSVRPLSFCIGSPELRSISFLNLSGLHFREVQGPDKNAKPVIMTRIDPVMTPREAARMLGISYPLIKQWIHSGKLKTQQTPGGHHRIAHSALKPFLAEDAEKSATESRERYRRVSGRNQIAGKVVSIHIEGILAEVVIAAGDSQITAVITAGAVRELGLQKGDTVAALIKSTDVMF
jgi:molybdopterin-binding protein